MTVLPDRPVGIAMLGAAHTGHAWAYSRALRESPTATLVGVHDPEAEHHRWLRQDFGVTAFDDADELLAHPQVEGVLVCSANVDHRRYVELAAARGKHVLCEKPIATTLDDAQAMLAACEEAGVQLHLAFVSRFLPVVALARTAVREGRLGDLIGVVGGNRGRPPLAPSYPAWITDASAAGGGALIDHSVHVSDVIHHVTGLDVVEVSAEAGALLWDCGVDDVAVVSLRFDNGAVGSIDSSWSVPEGNPWSYDFYLRLVGTEGSLAVTDGAEVVHLVSSRDDRPRGSRHASFAEDAESAMLEAFAASVRAGAPQEPCATGADGVRALEVALAGYRSSALGAVVDLRQRPMAGVTSSASRGDAGRGRGGRRH